jgi:predicted kinase
MKQPTLFLTVGLPATGKTTAARRLEVDHHALRLTKDEWMRRSTVSRTRRQPPT